MKTFTVTVASQVVSAAGPRRFIHIQNISAQDIYIQYDGDAAALTIANGIKVQPGDTWQLNNTPGLPLFTDAVRAITGGGTAEIRVQGES